MNKLYLKVALTAVCLLVAMPMAVMAASLPALADGIHHHAAILSGAGLLFGGITQQSAYPVNTQRTALAIAYNNANYIADLVLPRAQVGLKTFEYYSYPVAEAFTLPDTKVGRKSEPGIINLSGTATTATCDDFALDDVLPNDDIKNAPPGMDPLGRSTEQLTDYILLDREVRAAALVFGAANYPNGYKVTLAGNDQWDSGDAAADPIADINTALDTPLVRPNKLVFGQQVWNVVRTHSNIVAAVNRNNGTKGIATREDVANLFEVEEVIVGQSRLNTAKPGQTVSLSRVWGKFCAAIYVNKNFSLATKGGISWGATAQYGTRVSGELPAPRIGLNGAVINRVGESVKELVIASQAGYLISGAIA